MVTTTHLDCFNRIADHALNVIADLELQLALPSVFVLHMGEPNEWIFETTKV